MKLWLAYLKQRRKVLLAGILFSAILILSFGLYRLPVEAVLYPICLCAVLALIFLWMDYLQVRKKHLALTRIQDFNDILPETLTDAKGIEERDYQEILQQLNARYKETMASQSRAFSEMVEYYTVWVHQIKTPISSMRLTLQNEDTRLSRQLGNDLFRIEQYVEMVLIYLRLNSKTTDYVIGEYDLDRIIRQSVKKFSGEFISRKLTLVYEPVDVTVLTDEKWLSFVIEQVISNALKYTPSGSVTISLEPERKLCIRDTGMGIAGENLPRIFERGYTGYNGRVDKEASGIGLYLCKRICNNLGHRIEATSKVDEGTCIVIDLSKANLEVE